MNRAAVFVSGLVVSGVLGCSPGSTEGDLQLGRVSAALSVCDEEVPEDRYIDGFPAYSQCSDSEDEGIYSNNGIDTATSPQGDDWVRTQWSGGYQCTELANRYLFFKWSIDWQPQGNAGFWCDEEPPADSGLVLTQVPVHGDVMVLPPGSCGSDGTTGHVALVDTYDAERDNISVVQQNSASRGRFELSCAQCFLHVVANEGSASGPVASAGPSAEPSSSEVAPMPSAPAEPTSEPGLPPFGGDDAGTDDRDDDARPPGRPVPPAMPEPSPSQTAAPEASADVDMNGAPTPPATVPGVNDGPAPNATDTGSQATPPSNTSGFVPPKEPLPMASAPTASTPMTPAPQSSVTTDGSELAGADEDDAGCAFVANRTNAGSGAVALFFATVALCGARRRSRG